MCAVLMNVSVILVIFQWLGLWFYILFVEFLKGGRILRRKTLELEGCGRWMENGDSGRNGRLSRD